MLDNETKKPIYLATCQIENVTALLQLLHKVLWYRETREEREMDTDSIDSKLAHEDLYICISKRQREWLQSKDYDDTFTTHACRTSIPVQVPQKTKNTRQPGRFKQFRCTEMLCLCSETICSCNNKCNFSSIWPYEQAKKDSEDCWGTKNQLQPPRRQSLVTLKQRPMHLSNNSELIRRKELQDAHVLR